ncbi:MAG: hypothetical protein V3V18_02460 [Methylococcales bacterium]
MSVNFQYLNHAFQDSYHLKMAHWFIIVTSLVLFLHGVNTVEQNWDMLGYVGSAVSIEEADVSYMHNYVYQEFRAYSTDEEFENLTNTYNYRKVMFQDQDAFNQQIPFYKMRIIFVFLILGLSKLGFNMFMVSHMLSATLVSIGYYVFYHAYKKLINPIFWLFYPLFAIIFNIINLTQTVTADSLAFLWISLLCYSFINAHWKTFFLLLVTSILVRTELIFFVAIFSCYFMLFRPSQRIIAAASLLVSLILYLLINNYVGNYGWSTVFSFVFLSGMSATHPAEYSHVGVSFQQYLDVVINNLRLFVSNRSILLFETITLLQLILFWLSKKKECSISKMYSKLVKNSALTLTLLSLGYIISHYLIFPVLDSRFFVAQYVISTLGLLSISTSLIQKIDSDLVNQ